MKVPLWARLVREGTSDFAVEERVRSGWESLGAGLRLLSRDLLDEEGVFSDEDMSVGV